MIDRVQIVLGNNPADNVRACIRALVLHPHVQWRRLLQRLRGGA